MNLCKYLSICSGCHFPNQTYQQQSLLKLQHLRNLLTQAEVHFPEIKFKSIQPIGLRTRLDFTIENGKYGLYNSEKSIIDIDSCAQISDNLQKALTDFRKVSFPITKGSVRLRVGPSLSRGAWLDFANIDIKNLLLEKKTLQKILDLGFQIEIGQKGKSLVFIDNQFKLAEPKSHDWFQTKFANNNYVSLNCLISSFTQPSWISANVITDLILSWTSSAVVGPLQTIAEFGSGIGQFTLPLLSKGFKVDVFESHVQAAGFLQGNASTHSLDKYLNIYTGDFHKQTIHTTSNYVAAVVNPPRSGLKNFVYELIRLKTEKCIYISCHPESFTADLKILAENGWQLQDVVLVDQFPQTKHFETCVLLKRINP